MSRRALLLLLLLLSLLIPATLGTAPDPNMRQVFSPYWSIAGGYESVVQLHNYLVGQPLAIRLQAVVHRMQKFCQHTMACAVPRSLEFGGQLPHALARPPQRRPRITASHRFHQRLQIALEGRVLVDGSFSPSAFVADSLAARRLRRSPDLSQSADHGSARQAVRVIPNSATAASESCSGIRHRLTEPSQLSRVSH